MSAAIVADTTGWLDRLRDARNRLLASRRFQAFATSFPLTRPLARREARAAFDLCAGFVYSQVLAACVQLDLLRRLSEGARAVPALAAATRVPEPALRRLLAAAASLRLLEDRGADGYALGPLGAAILGNPGVAAMVHHHALLYDDLRDPVALLRGEGGTRRLAEFWAYAATDAPGALPAERVAAYSDLMAASQSLVTDELLAAYDFRRHRRLLDVGGGDGSFAMAAARLHPHLAVELFDVPSVAARAAERIAAAGLADRVRATGGDFLRDALPGGADVVTLVRVLHDHDDEAALALLRRVRAALPPDGVLLVAEPFAATRGAEPVGAAYFSFYFLAMGHGRARSPREIGALFDAAGFGAPRQRRTRVPLQAGVIEARPARRAGSVNST